MRPRVSLGVLGYPGVSWGNQTDPMRVYSNSRQGSWVRYPVWQHTFVSPSAFSRRAVVSYWRKYVHEVLVNRLGGLCLPRKSVVRLTDRPDMTLDVYRGRKTTMQQQNFNSRNDVPRVAQRYGTIAAHTRRRASVHVVFVVFCVHVYSFASLIRRTPRPTFSDTAITDRHSDTSIFQLRAGNWTSRPIANSAHCKLGP